MKLVRSCYKKGTLLTTLKQNSITCLPKRNKDRILLKIGDLSLCYVQHINQPIIAVIANQMKPELSHIISESQIGFLKGPVMAESIRLKTDIPKVTASNLCDLVTPEEMSEAC